MAPVLVIITIPYEHHSELNEKLEKSENVEEEEIEEKSEQESEQESSNQVVDVKYEQNKNTVVNEELEKKVSITDDVTKLDGERNPSDETIEESAKKKMSVTSKKKDNVASNKKDSVASKFMKKSISLYDLTKVCQNILDICKVDKASWVKTYNGEFWQIMFQLDTKLVDNLLNKLLTAGIGNNDFSSVSIVPITVNFPSMNPEKEDAMMDSNGPNKKEKSEFLQSIKSRMNVAQVITSVQSGSQLTFDYIMLLLLASIIAAVGLFENSSVLLVASMLVSPLMGPILGGTFGLVLQSKRVWKPAILNELLGLGICLIMGFFFGVICGLGILPDWDYVTSEMKSRGEYRSLYVGVFIAVPSGAAVALSILGGNAGSLVGVAISASLLPPAVNAGIFWAFAIICASKGTLERSVGNSSLVSKAPSQPLGLRYHEPTELAKFGAISMTLTIINIIIIFVMGVVILKIKEVAPRTGTAVTKDFWKHDLKKTREILNKHRGAHEEIEDEVIEEWSKINKIDLTDKATLSGPKAAAVAKELKNILDTIDRENMAISSKLNYKSGTRMVDKVKEKLQTLELVEPSRFTVAPVANDVYIPMETTFVSRFAKTRLDEVDLSIKKSASNISIHKISATETQKKISKPNVLTVDFAESRFDSEEELLLTNTACQK